MPITESNIYGLWVAKQSDKGTPAAASVKRLQQVGGDFDLNREDGSENFSDLDRFGGAVDYINMITGQGEPVIHAQPSEVAYLSYLFFGGQTFTAATGSTPPKFVFTPGATTGFWSTWWKRVGLTQVVRHKFNDCKITSLKFEGSTANKIVKVTPTVTSLDPGEVFTSDPATAISTVKPFLYTDAVGTATIDGTVFTGQTQFSITINDGQEAIQADSVRPNDFVAGAAQITMEGPTLLLDANALAKYNTIIYGTASPSAAAKPISTAPVVGSYSVEFSRGTTTGRESLKLELPGVKWEPNIPIAPNPDGGAIEIALNGQMRKVSGSPAVRVTVETGTTGDSAAYT